MTQSAFGGVVLPPFFFLVRLAGHVRLIFPNTGNHLEGSSRAHKPRLTPYIGTIARVRRAGQNRIQSAEVVDQLGAHRLVGDAIRPPHRRALRVRVLPVPGPPHVTDGPGAAMHVAPFQKPNGMIRFPNVNTNKQQRVVWHGFQSGSKWISSIHGMLTSHHLRHNQN